MVVLKSRRERTALSNMSGALGIHAFRGLKLNLMQCVMGKEPATAAWLPHGGNFQRRNLSAKCRMCDERITVGCRAKRYPPVNLPFPAALILGSHNTNRLRAVIYAGESY